MTQFFTILFDLFRKRRIFFILLILVFAGTVGYLASRLKFVEDIYKVIPADEKVEKYTQVLQHSRFADQMVMYITPADPLADSDPVLLISFAEAMEDSLQSSFYPQLVANFRIRMDESQILDVYDEIYSHLPLFLEEEDYREMMVMTDRGQAALRVGSAYKSLLSPAGFATRDFILKDPLGITSLVTEKIQGLQVDESYALYNGFIFSADRRYLMAFLTPAHPSTETTANAVLMERLDELIRHLTLQFDGKVTADYFGSAAISVSNARQIKADITLTMILAATVLSLFILLYFRRKFYFLAIFFPAILGGGLSMAILYLVRTEVSAISLGFGAVLLGITIDYAMHFLNDLREADDPRTVIRDLAIPITMSSLTTAGAFFSLLLVRSEAIADLGLFAGFSVLGAAFFTLLILPHLPKGKKDRRSIRTGFPFLEKFAAYPLEKNKPVFYGILLLTLLFFFTSKWTIFESDMTGMSYMDPRLVRAEGTLDTISRFTLRSVFLLSPGNDLEEALQNQEALMEQVDALEKEGLVKKHSGVDGFLLSTEKQQRRIDRWNAFWAGGRRDSVLQEVRLAAAGLGIKPEAFSEFYHLLEKEYRPVPPASFEKISSGLLSPFISEDTVMTTLTTVLKVRQEDKPALYERLRPGEGYFIFDKQFLTSTFMEVLKEDFDKLVFFSLLLVFLIMLFIFGRIELTIITFIPMFLSWIWTLGIMGLAGIHLNIFNIIITSFVFGLGIDYSIFIMQGMLQEYKFGRKRLPTFRVSILLAALTTLVGIGALILGKHPALRSIAITAIIGITSVWLVTWVMEPALFRWLVYLKDRKRPVPVTLKDFLFAILSLTIFVVGTILLLVYGFIFFTLFRIKKGRIKDWFHLGMMYSTQFLIYANFLSPKNIIDRDPRDLKKPAVLIANHQSHIDIAMVLRVHPRLLELTNDRVQHSFLYGPLMKMAEFLPVSDGMDLLAEKLKKNVAEGYSILIFPEGTRSPDEQVHRFHKGAFYLAEKLNIDILPLIIHGSGPVMTKGEYFLKWGIGTIKFLPRIAPEDESFGKGLLEKSRGVRRYMAAEYQKVADMVETPSYFRERVIKNYVYKGPVLEWYIRIKIRMEKDYAVFHEHLPKHGHITDLGCGYGFMTYMLMFLSRHRTLTGFDYDTEKIAVASHCPGKNERLEFIAMDVTRADIPESDGIIISDVLHYMPEEEQEKLIIRSIQALKKEGVLMIRDADREMSKAHRKTRFSEYLSTNIGFNRTISEDKKLYFTSGNRILKILEDHGMEVNILEESRSMSNVIFVAKKTAGSRA